MNDLAACTVGLIGLGQIGGSMGLDLVAARAAGNVIGYDVDESAMRAAFEREAVDSVVESLSDLPAEADLIVMATPIRVTIDLLPKLARSVGKETVLTDVAGTKTDILRTVDENNLSGRYVGSHPMAGTEGTGFDSASVDLFKDKPVVITPASGADSSSVALVERLWRAVGAETFRMGANEHDQAVAFTSHLPYAIAVGLARMAADETEKAADLAMMMAGSFRSATRVAASSPDLTLDMWLTNREKTAERIERLSDRLRGLADTIRKGDQDQLRGEVEAARAFVIQPQKS